MAKRNRRRPTPNKRAKSQRGYEGGGIIFVGLHLLGMFLESISVPENKNVRSFQETQDAEFEVIEPKKLTDGKEKGSEKQG